MTPAQSPWVVALVVGLATLAFVALVRLPLPFPGFTAVAAACLALFGTLALGAWLPARLLWTDTERLTAAFKARHDIMDARAESALHAIAGAHSRAAVLREGAAEVAPELADRAAAMADRLDMAAREIFYDPGRLPALRAIITRSELISDAMETHRKLRARMGDSHQTTQSREKLIGALDALDQAFEASDVATAERLLAEVDAASTTAESLLAPRRRIRV